jgi:putative ABC transport system permease protein
VLAEAVLLGLGGGVLGLVGSLWGIRLVLSTLGAPLPFWIQLGVDWRLIGFTLGLALLAGIAFGLLPALRAARADLNETLKTGAAGGTAGRREGRLRSTLVVAQIALSLVLLTGAGLMIKSFLVERHPTGLGYNPAGVLTARFELQPARYDDSAQVRLFQQELVTRLAGQPGFPAAAVESHIFLGSFIGHSTRVQLEGESEPVSMERGPSHGSAVSTDYFRLMEIPVLRGRTFTGQDRIGSPGVAVVNGEAARRYWPNGDPLGKRLKIGEGPWLTVVGLVGDLSRRPMGSGFIPLVYTAAAQDAARPFRVLVRFRGDQETASTTLKAVARAIDPDEPVEDILTLEEDLALQLTPIRIMMYLLGGLGAIALGLAAFGLYGVMAYVVARRNRELGIRAALGAEAARLWRYVVSQGLRLTAFGVGLGMIGAFFLTRTLQQVLFNVRSTDPFVYGAVASLLALIALLACWGPARRATRVDPIEVLREE